MPFDEALLVPKLEASVPIELLRVETRGIVIGCFQPLGSGDLPGPVNPIQAIIWQLAQTPTRGRFGITRARGDAIHLCYSKDELPLEIARFFEMIRTCNLG